MRLNRQYMYPLGVLVALGLMAFLLTVIVAKVGPRVNPPQASKRFEKGMKGLVVWEAEGQWMASEEGDFSLFETSTKELKGKSLQAVLQALNTKILFILVRADIGQEKGKNLLSSFVQQGIEGLYVASPFDNTLSNLAKVESRLLMAPSPKVWVKWSLISSFGGMTLFDPKSDFLFIDNKVADLLKAGLADEIVRRNLPVIRTGADQKSIKY